VRLPRSVRNISSCVVTEKKKLGRTQKHNTVRRYRADSKNRTDRLKLATRARQTELLVMSASALCERAQLTFCRGQTDASVLRTELQLVCRHRTLILIDALSVFRERSLIYRLTPPHIRIHTQRILLITINCW